MQNAERRNQRNAGADEWLSLLRSSFFVLRSAFCVRFDARFPKFVLAVNGLVPLGLLLWDASRGQLGANPVEFATRTTGMLALIFLCLSLTVTPARKISGWNGFSHFRRMLGLLAFFYGSLHLLTYVWFDRGWSPSGVLADTTRRPFVLFGMTCFLLMAPLAATSTNGMIKRLGAKRWKQLHRLAYYAAIAGAIHYWMLVKADTRQPLIFAGVIAALLIYRIVVSFKPAGARLRASTVS